MKTLNSMMIGLLKQYPAAMKADPEHVEATGRIDVQIYSSTSFAIAPL